MTEDRKQVGFIGLGAMGLPMAKRIVRAGYKTCTTFHRRQEPAAELAAMGAQVLPTARDVAKMADAIITILPADRELREVAVGGAGIVGVFAPGKVLLEMTTATPSVVQEIAAAITGLGGGVLDAPVSGGTSGAEQGTLAIMVGGDAALVDFCRPL